MTRLPKSVAQLAFDIRSYRLELWQQRGILGLSDGMLSPLWRSRASVTIRRLPRQIPETLKILLLACPCEIAIRRCSHPDRRASLPLGRVSTELGVEFPDPW